MRSLLRMKIGSPCLIAADETEPSGAGGSDAAAASASEAGSTDVYRASGTEPFWSLTIGNGEMVYAPADGATVTVAVPEPSWSRAGPVYETAEMTVSINQFRRCQGADGREYHDTVRVTIGTETMEGCGGAPSDESATD